MKKVAVFLLSVWTLVGCHMDIPSSPTANFDVVQEGAGLVTYKNKSVNASSYSWDFGDGKTENTADITIQHTYATGTYTVRLIAKGDAGSAGTSQQVKVEATAAAKPPVADFSYTTNNNQEAPCNGTFVNNSTGNITSYEWKVNGASFSTEKNPVYTFQNPGTYTIVLTAKGPGGTNDKPVDIVIKSKAASAPVAKFTVSGGGGVAKVSATFNNTSEGADTFIWNFDDGQTSTEKSPSHDFTRPGVYNVILIATGAGGVAKVAGEVVVLSPARVTQLYNGNNIASSTITYKYTGSDNLLSEIDDSNGNDDFVNASTYDFSGQVLTRKNYNQTLKSATGTQGTIDFKYNDLGQLTESNHRFTRPNNGYQTGDRGNNYYEYGPSNIVSKITADSVIYTYSAVGVLTNISYIGQGTAQKTKVDGVVYSGSPVVRDGHIVSYAYTDGAYRNISYDSKGQKIMDAFEDPGRGKKITENWSYDDKVNPAMMESKFKGHPYYAQYGFGTNINNIVRYSRVVQNTSSTNNQSYSYNIEYNDKGLPTAIRKAGDDQDEKKLYTYSTR